MNVVGSSNGIIAINLDDDILAFCPVILKDIYVEKRDFYSAKDATVTFN